MTITTLCLLLLTSALLLNFALLWRLLLTPQTQLDSESLLPLTLPINQAVMAVSGYRLAEPQAEQNTVTLPALPTLVVFLSARCHSCRGKVPQLEQLLPAMQAVELTFWLVVIEAGNDEAASHKAESNVADFLTSSPLWPYAMGMQPEVIKYLNPRTASPFYLMLDERRQLQASGMLGDADWQSFVEQMEAQADEPSQPQL